MEREISSGAMLGIVLLALAAVIGLGFAIFAIAKGVANEGTVNVQDSLGAVSTQVFLDYDQKVVTGTQAASAIKTFEGKPYAVLINTKAMAAKQKIASQSDRPKGQEAYFISDGKYAYLNYNALLAVDSSGNPSKTVVSGGNAAPSPSGTGEITLKNGAFVADYGFAVDNNGDVLYDKATGGVFKSGNAEYIPSNTKFQANLLKDKSGAIMGVVLRQL